MRRDDMAWFVRRLVKVGCVLTGMIVNRMAIDGAYGWIAFTVTLWAFTIAGDLQAENP